MRIGHSVNVTGGLDVVVARHVDPDGDDEDEQIQNKRGSIQGSTGLSSSPRWSSAASAVKTSAPKNVAKNAGLRIARSIDWNAATNVRSSVRRSPGMIALL